MPLIDTTAREFRLAACCPRCKRRPKLRLRQVIIDWTRELEPETVLQSYQCHASDCNERYLLAAVAFQHAEPDPPVKQAA